MAVTTTTSRASYSGDGTTTVFPVPFYFLTNADLKVYVGSTELSTGYTVSGAGDEEGGSVSITPPPAAGVQTLILRDPDLLQQTRLPPNDPFPAKAVETMADKLTMIVQRNGDQIGRALVLADSDVDGSGAYRAKQNRIQDLGDAVDSQDAVNLRTMQTAIAENVMTGGGDSVLALLANNTDVTLGSSMIGFKQSGTGSVGRTLAKRAADMLSVADKGNPSNLTTALTNIAADLTNGGIAYVPRGGWTLQGTYTFSGQRLRIIGEGQNSSQIIYSPTSAGVALAFNNGSAGGVYQGRISGIGFSSDPSNTVAKTAISLVNCADFEVSRIGIAGGNWPGDSIGIRSYGRQTLSLHHCEIACARPLVFSKNATWPTLNTDHYDVFRCEISSTSATRAAIEFEDGVAFSTTTLRNLAITGGKDGILWNDTTSTAASFGLGIHTVRFEQGMDPAGYCINLASTAQTLQTLTIRDVTLDTVRNGIRLRRAQRVLMENVSFNMGAGKVALDMTFEAGSRLTLINCYSQTGATFTLTNAKCIRREMNAAGALNEEWIFDDGGMGGVQQSGVARGGVPFTLAATGNAALATNAFVGHVDIMNSQGVAATFLLAGTNGITFEVADGAGQFSATKGTASSTNVYYDAATATYRVENNRGMTLNYAASLRGNGNL
ncbi:hypothetical protein PCA31118_04667 [Pandoraea captiosa]|uniref:Tail fiber protein n=1 Tax=Pandoraea captiosa TaxID=2508302 RepID=A0A5E5AJU7_9BURK|nr:hypothetical protein [Pandoraea captiosa]VVE74041.1 hypothetical protein PCA31118_04667 [Pandoraea captiosa]